MCLADNKRGGVQSNFLIDNNLVINIDDICENPGSISDEALREANLYDLVAFLLECQRQKFDFELKTGFGYSKMPEYLARQRATAGSKTSSSPALMGSRVFHKAVVQLCIVHMVCLSLNYVSWKRRKDVAADLRRIYQAATAEEAELRLGEFKAKCDSDYLPIGC